IHQNTSHFTNNVTVLNNGQTGQNLTLHVHACLGRTNDMRDGPDRPFLGSTRTQHTVSNAFSAIASSRSRSPAIAHACTEHGRIYSFGVATLLTRRIATYVLLLKCNVAGSVASAARAVARVIPYSHEN